MINTQTASSVGDTDDQDTTTIIVNETIVSITAPNQSISNNEIAGNKILISNVTENISIEMNDDAIATESNTNNNNNSNANILCTSDSNNSLNCSRNGVDRRDTYNCPSSAGSGQIPRTDSNPQNHLSPATSSLSPIQLSPCRSLDSVSDDDFDEIGKLFETKSKAIERWLKEKASQDVLTRIHAASDYARLPKSPKRTSSVTSDLFQLWLASSPVQVSTRFTYYHSKSYDL